MAIQVCDIWFVPLYLTGDVMKFKKIKDIKELKELAKNKLYCCILLNFGLKSSKEIVYVESSGKFYIFNNIDDSTERLTEQELWTKSNIGKALDRGALVIEVE